MIISASYRTDIPAFYSQWFFNRLRAGWCRVRNPYSGKPARVDLRPESVTGFVFWTRNFAPVLARAAELHACGRPYVVQFTITGYPRTLETAVIPPAAAVDQIRRLSVEVHPLCPVWRYDPIVFSSETTPDFHRRNFASLAAALEGASTEVVVSFAQIYAKSRRNLDAAAARHGLQWHDPDDSVKIALADELAQTAASRGMKLTICTQPRYLSPASAEARCVDARRLSAIAGLPLAVPLKGNRPGCACHESRDIGEYDTCPHGCAYCYAVRNRPLALRRYKAHDPDGDSLLPLPPEPSPASDLFLFK
ncbi:MAG: DUF1848 domain-containing protein [Candidatus Solibacter usitatus]|nr:DUF1848 domain-containing protein [Candidatus Solibacter usitatus]